MMIANAAPSAPVMNHLRAVDDVVVAVALARSCSIDGIGAGARRRLGHAEARADVPAASGRSQRSFCSGVATASSRWMLPSSGASMLSAIGPSGE